MAGMPPVDVKRAIAEASACGTAAHAGGTEAQQQPSAPVGVSEEAEGEQACAREG